MCDRRNEAECFLKKFYQEPLTEGVYPELRFNASTGDKIRNPRYMT
jgi:hypothetical protein